MAVSGLVHVPGAVVATAFVCGRMLSGPTTGAASAGAPVMLFGTCATGTGYRLPEAKARVEGGQVRVRPKARPRSAPFSHPGPPPEAWQEAARALVNECAGILNGPRGEAARGYLYQRGLNDRTIWRGRLGLNLQERRIGKLRVDAGIVIPWVLDGDLWAVNVRCWQGDKVLGKPKYRALAGSVKALYGAEHLRGVRIAVVCEGEFDALLLQQEAAYKKVPIGAVAVGATGGLHDAAVKQFLPCVRILVCGDNDEAGSAFAERWQVLSAGLPRSDGLLAARRPSARLG